ncbi:hypothetical protein Tdes44962_MAKER04138 [Teratosphaeria destructans]|uniref:Uncharacterized protein n=1 Tax=Teratosphaeria destructans TaxID=418781 RepID=A0A9W7SNF6_9PEZI|nr:hypothetical protein Tdes44962_MAKER04138 [Teratosphaeria destructans]
MPPSSMASSAELTAVGLGSRRCVPVVCGETPQAKRVPSRSQPVIISPADPVMGEKWNGSLYCMAGVDGTRAV